MAKDQELGPTGDFPSGKFNEEDEGGLMTGITHDKGVVIINFGKPVAWIGFPPEMAFQFARSIAEHAHAAMRDITESKDG
jgi:hypothetical protein